MAANALAGRQKTRMPGAVALLSAARAGRIVGWRYAYPTYSLCGLPLIYSPCWLKLPVLMGLKIAETFPEGRGSPHGCGLRAVTCRDAASARPEACRDKSKEPRSGDFSGQSPGVQRAAATGRPLCAPCATENILHKNQTGAQYPLKRHAINVFSQAKKLQTDSSIYDPLTAIPGADEAQRKPWKGRYFFGRYFSGSSGTGRLSSIR